MRATIILCLTFIFYTGLPWGLPVQNMLSAQDPLSYQRPPDDILKLVDVPLAPGVLMDKDKSMMVLLYRDAYKSIEELSQEEMRLGGLRIDPNTNIGSRTTYYNKVAVRKVTGESAVRDVRGLPENPRLAQFFLVAG